ncbi:MAG: lactonase family protein [Caulobacterales bacterium]|nr:lactonase family protein [Caulobacterales bacterium]
MQGALAYVGCRTSRERNARGDGINVYRVPLGGGAWTHMQLVGDLFNPSYLAFGPGRRTLYAVHGDASEVSAFRVDPADGRLTFLNRASTHGMNPVHLALDRTGRFVVIPNHVTTAEYASGLTVLALGPDGALGDLTDLLPLKGKVGPHRVEQPFPKPHQARLDPTGRFFVVPDKGRDVVESYRLDAAGKLSLAGSARAQEGAGPRHVAFTPDARFAYVLNELNSTIEAFRFDTASGALSPFQVLPALPDSFTGDSRASEIEVSADGRFVYASNRGADDIGVFAIETATGRLAPRGWQGSGGKTPRFFALSPDGHTLFAANEDGDSLMALAIDPRAGGLGQSREVARTGSPTCIVFG